MSNIKDKKVVRGWAMEPTVEGSYVLPAGVHNNSGGLTCGNSLCQSGESGVCESEVEYSIRAVLVEEQDDTSRFDKYVSNGCQQISKVIAAKSCDFEALTIWFNKINPRTVEINSWFDMQNDDDCKHIVISNNLCTAKSQNFDSRQTGYYEGGTPKILVNPCEGTSTEIKYPQGDYIGNRHKTKYHVCSSDTWTSSILNSQDVVEIYFPNYSGNTDSGANITEIAANAFTGCKSLTAITLNIHMRKIGASAFQNLTKLTHVDFAHNGCIPSNNNLYYIGENAFKGCTALSEICLSSIVTSSDVTIGKYAFANCSSATILKFPNIYSGYHIISEGCFSGCSSLTGVTIPDNITNINNDAFKGCSSLTKITVRRTTPCSIGTGVFDGVAEGCKIKVPSSLVQTYQSAWSAYANMIEAI